MAINTHKHASLGRKATAALVTGLLALGAAPMASIVPALAAEDTVVVTPDETTIQSEPLGTQELTQDVDLSQTKIDFDQSSFVYNGKEQKPKVTVSLNNNVVAESCYKVTYGQDCTNVQKEVTVTIEPAEGSTRVTNSNQKTYAITPAPFASSMVTLSKDSVTANGEVQKPTVTVKDMFTNVTLDEGAEDDYTVDYGDGEYKKAGTYTITIKAIKNFEGSLTRTFTINEDVGAIPITGKAHVQKDGDKDGLRPCAFG